MGWLRLFVPTTAIFILLEHMYVFQCMSQSVYLSGSQSVSHYNCIHDVSHTHAHTHLSHTHDKCSFIHTKCLQNYMYIDIFIHIYEILPSQHKHTHKRTRTIWLVEIFPVRFGVLVICLPAVFFFFSFIFVVTWLRWSAINKTLQNTNI